MPQKIHVMDSPDCSITPSKAKIHSGPVSKVSRIAINIHIIIYRSHPYWFAKIPPALEAAKEFIPPRVIPGIYPDGEKGWGIQASGLILQHIRAEREARPLKRALFEV